MSASVRVWVQIQSVNATPPSLSLESRCSVDRLNPDRVAARPATVSILHAHFTRFRRSAKSSDIRVEYCKHSPIESGESYGGHIFYHAITGPPVDFIAKLASWSSPGSSSVTSRRTVATPRALPPASCNASTRARLSSPWQVACTMTLRSKPRRSRNARTYDGLDAERRIRQRAAENRELVFRPLRLHRRVDPLRDGLVGVGIDNENVWH